MPGKSRPTDKPSVRKPGLGPGSSSQMSFGRGPRSKTKGPTDHINTRILQSLWFLESPLVWAFEPGCRIFRLCGLQGPNNKPSTHSKFVRPIWVLRQQGQGLFIFRVEPGAFMSSGSPEGQFCSNREPQAFQTPTRRNSVTNHCPAASDIVEISVKERHDS